MLYMHTIDGKPGFWDGEQIVYAEDRTRWRDEYPLCVVHRSIAALEREQIKSARFRRRHGFDIPRYGYVVISTKPGTLPAPDDKET